jgi:DNA-binding NarL/FixJ family response regulator
MLGIAIVVADPVPAYRRGLEAVLEDAGFLPEQPSDLEAWVALKERRAVLLTVDRLEDCDVLARLRGTRRDLVVVALLRDPTLRMYLEALRKGASGTVAWDAPPEKIRKVLEAALDDECLLPLPLVQALVEVKMTGGGPVPSPE